MHQTDQPTTDDTTTRRYDDGDRTLLSAIVEAVAAETGRDPLELDPLYDALDAAALERVVAPDRDTGSLAGRLRFRFESCEVTVTGDGRVTAARIESQSR
ncbi:HalOD1 output domain-containing protein [Halosimplex halobium]|uniref:HalOD1 output domain-containing protein n=1 Tax=Halosimplex halobium TaxID=3396618 RepID=UPI003F545A98